MYSSFNARAIGLSLSATETIDIAYRAGFKAVDLMVRDLTTAGERPKDLRNRMNDLGLVGGAFPLPVNWRGNESCFLNDLADLKGYAEVAATLGLTCTGTWVTPEIPPGLNGPDGYRSTVAFHLDRLGAIASVLEPYGIHLGLEAIGVERFRTNRTPIFITRISDLQPIFDPLRQAHPHVGILLDTFHLFAANEPLEEAIATGASTIVWVHVADLPSGATPDRSQIEDSQRGLPGDHGAIDNRFVLQTLRDRGYRGPVTVEPLACCSTLNGLNAREAAQAVTASLQAHWPI